MRTWALIQVSIDIMAARNIIQLDWRQIADDVVFHELVNSLLDALFPSYVPGRTKRISDGGWDGGLFTLPLNKLGAGKGKGSVMVQAKFTEKTGTPAKNHLQSELKGTSRKPGEMAKAQSGGAQVLLLVTAADLGVVEVKALEALAPEGLKVVVWARAKLEQKIRNELLLVSRFFGVPGVPSLLSVREAFAGPKVLALTDRGDDVDAVEAMLTTDASRAVILKAPGGTGKTECLRQIGVRIEKRARVVYLQPDVQSPQDVVQVLPHLGDAVVIVDDVDRVLDYMRPVISAVLTAKACSRIKLLLATRTAGIGSVRRALAQHGVVKVHEHELSPLDARVLRDVLARTGLHEYQVGSALRATRGNLFLLSEYISALRGGGMIRELSPLRASVAVRLEHDFREVQVSLSFVPGSNPEFLSAVALATPFDGASARTLRFVTALSGVNAADTRRLLIGMENVGLTRRAGRKTRMSADMFADLLLADRVERLDGSEFVCRAMELAMEHGLEEAVLANVEGASWCGSTGAEDVLKTWLERRRADLRSVSVVHIRQSLQLTARIAAATGRNALEFLVAATSELAARHGADDPGAVVDLDLVAPILLSTGTRPDCASSIARVLIDVGAWIGPGQYSNNSSPRIGETLSNPMIRTKHVIDSVLSSMDSLLLESTVNPVALGYMRGVLEANFSLTHDVRSFSDGTVTNTQFTYSKFDSRIRARRAQCESIVVKALEHPDELVRQSALEVIDRLPRSPSTAPDKTSALAALIRERNRLLVVLAQRLVEEPHMLHRQRIRALLFEEWLDAVPRAFVAADALRTTPRPIDELMMVCCGSVGLQPLNFPEIESAAPSTARARWYSDRTFDFRDTVFARVRCAFTTPAQLADALHDIEDAGCKGPHILGHLLWSYADGAAGFVRALVRQFGSAIPSWARSVADSVEIARSPARARCHLRYVLARNHAERDHGRVREVMRSYASHRKMNTTVWRFIVVSTASSSSGVRQAVFDWIAWGPGLTARARATLFSRAMEVQFDDDLASKLNHFRVPLNPADSATVRPILRSALLKARVVGHPFGDSTNSEVVRWMLGDDPATYLQFMCILVQSATSWNQLQAETVFRLVISAMPTLKASAIVDEVVELMLEWRTRFTISEYDFEKLVSEVRAQCSDGERVRLCRLLLERLGPSGAKAAAFALTGVDPRVAVPVWSEVLKVVSLDTDVVEERLVQGALYDDVGLGTYMTDFNGPCAQKAEVLKELRTKTRDPLVLRCLNRAIQSAEQVAHDGATELFDDYYG